MAVVLLLETESEILETKRAEAGEYSLEHETKMVKIRDVSL